MKQDKVAKPGLYVKFFKASGKAYFELAVWIREDYTFFWARPGQDAWCTLLWSCGPRKHWERKAETNAKSDYATWWEKFETLESLRIRVGGVEHVSPLEGEIPDLKVWQPERTAKTRKTA